MGRMNRIKEALLIVPCGIEIEFRTDSEGRFSLLIVPCGIEIKSDIIFIT